MHDIVHGMRWIFHTISQFIKTFLFFGSIEVFFPKQWYGMVKTMVLTWLDNGRTIECPVFVPDISQTRNDSHIILLRKSCDIFQPDRGNKKFRKCDEAGVFFNSGISHPE